MSAKQREMGEAQRAKYARVFNIPVEDVKLEWTDNEDATIYADGLPVWTLGAGERGWHQTPAAEAATKATFSSPQTRYPACTCDVPISDEPRQPRSLHESYYASDTRMLAADFMTSLDLGAHKDNTEALAELLNGVRDAALGGRE